MGCSGGKYNSTDSSETVSSDKTLNKNKHLNFNERNLIIKNPDPLLKHYKILHPKLAEGCLVKIYKGIHIKTNQLRAIKYVKKSLIKMSNMDFMKEVEILAKLDHPHIIKIYEYFMDNAFLYVIMELATGRQLYEQIHRIQFFSELEAAVIMKQIFSCVFYLHEHGIVHCNINSEAIFLETEDNLSVKLIDFGQSNYYDKNSNKKLKLELISSYYNAPEVIENNYDIACDLWSCGVIMYMMLCGQYPFDGKDDESIKNQIMKGNYSIDNETWKDVSIEAKNLIRKLLIKDKKKRITAQSALNDPWIIKFSNEKKSDKLIKICTDVLKNSLSKNKLQKASMSFLIHQMSTNEIIQNLRTVFKEIDTSGDGRLSINELKVGYSKYFSQTLSNLEFDEMIKNIDSDENGYIEYEEFLKATINTESIVTENNLKMAFDYFDNDKSGKLSIEEVKFVLSLKSDDPRADEILRKIMDEVDINGDGELNYEEFKIIMKKNVY